MKQGTTVVFSFRESPEGGYEARALGYSIFTQAETIDQLGAMISEALFCHFNHEVPYRLGLASDPRSSE